MAFESNTHDVNLLRFPCSFGGIEMAFFPLCWNSFFLCLSLFWIILFFFLLSLVFVFFFLALFLSISFYLSLCVFLFFPSFFPFLSLSLSLSLSLCLFPSPCTHFSFSLSHSLSFFLFVRWKYRLPNIVWSRKPVEHLVPPRNGSSKQHISESYIQIASLLHDFFWLRTGWVLL